MAPSATGLAPGVSIRFVDPPPAVSPVAVDVPVFICVCERGPLYRPVRVGSWPAFVAVFGSFVANGLGAYAVKAFFDQGGRVAWIVRVAAAAATTGPVGPQPADRLRSVLADLTGFAVGAAATVRQGSTVQTYLVQGMDGPSATVTWDRPLHADYDLTAGFDVSTGASASTTTLPDAGGAAALAVAASSPGAWGDHLVIVVGAGRRAATGTRGDDPAGPSATPVVTTDGFVAGSSVTVTQAVGAAATSVVAVVDHVDAAERVIWWFAPLPASIDPLRPMQLETDTFSLSVLRDGVTAEVWPDLSVVAAHPRYAPAVLAGSALLGAVEVLGAAAPAPGRAVLAGGRDGTAALSPNDLVGDIVLGDDSAATPGVLRDLDEPAAVAVPDLVAGPTPATITLSPPDDSDPCAPCPPALDGPPALAAVIVEAGASFGSEAIVRAQHQLVEACQRHTERIALLDPPCGAGSLMPADLRDWGGRFSSDYAVATVPWLLVLDPLAPAGSVRRVPPCGHVAGVIAQTDALDGPWLAAANRSLVWAHGIDSELTTTQHGLLNDQGIDVIRALPGRGLVPMGARTLSADPLWVFAAVRRTMIYLRRALRVSLAWVVFEPADTRLSGLLTTAIGTLLRDVWEAGGLAGATPDEAFFVHVDQSGAVLGELLIVIGVALTRPAEFVTVQVSRVENGLELSEAPRLVVVDGSL